MRWCGMNAVWKTATSVLSSLGWGWIWAGNGGMFEDGFRNSEGNETEVAQVDLVAEHHN